MTHTRKPDVLPVEGASIAEALEALEVLRYFVNAPPVGVLPQVKAWKATDTIRSALERAAAEGEARASSVCPVCGNAEPHGHTREQVNVWINGTLARFGYEATVFALGARERSELRLLATGWEAGHRASADDACSPHYGNGSNNPYLMRLSRLAIQASLPAPPKGSTP